MRKDFRDFLIIANGSPPSQQLLSSLTFGKMIVAVDGGLKICDEFGVEPDLILGDFDSVPNTLLEKYKSTKIYTPDQNKCDLEKALEYLFSLYDASITVLGALGQRIDHELTNICLLCRYPEKVKFETENEQCFALNRTHELFCEVGQTFSLIPLGEVTQVTTTGLKWNLNSQTLDKNFVGISNLTTQKKVTISFTNGDLVLCLTKPLLRVM